MFSNNTERLAERLRAKEGITEIRLTKMKVHASRGGVLKSNPLLSQYADDATVMKLKLDAAQLKSLVCGAGLRVSCFMPCCFGCTNIPHLLGQVAKVTAAHHLTLKEKSLHLKVDPYPSILQGADVLTMGATTIFTPCFKCMFWNKTSPIEEVLPLEEVQSVCIETCKEVAFGLSVSPDTLVVRIRASQYPIFAINCPDKEQGQNFCDAVMKQVSLVKEGRGEGVPQDAFLSYISTVLPSSTTTSSNDTTPNIQTMMQRGPMPGTGTGVGKGAGGEVDRGLAGEIKKLNDLKSQGILTDEEFAAAKAKVIAAY